MNKLRAIITILFLSLLLVGATSCLVRSHTDNEKHGRWFQKHDNNRHKKGTVIIYKENEKEKEKGHHPSKNDDRD